MAMSRKHYDAIAGTFKSSVKEAYEHDAVNMTGLLLDLAVLQCRVFKKDNANFRVDMFLMACGFSLLNIRAGCALVSDI